MSPFALAAHHGEMTTHTLSTPLLAAPAATTRAPMPVHRRAPLATLALVSLPIAVLAMVAIVLAASLIGPFIMFAIPLMLVFGCALGPLHALIRGELR